MPMPSKGLTWTFNLRATSEEKAAVVATVAEYAQHGVKISMNDAVRILIRRATAPLVVAVDPLREQMAEHWEACPHCTPDMPPACPEGRRLKFVHDRLVLLQAPAPEQEPAEREPAAARPLEGRVIPLPQRGAAAPSPSTLSPAAAAALAGSRRAGEFRA